MREGHDYLDRELDYLGGARLSTEKKFAPSVGKRK